MNTVVPTHYTEQEGGFWKPWSFGHIDREVLSLRGKHHLTIDVGSDTYVKVFALRFLIGSDWDCVVGFRSPDLINHPSHYTFSSIEVIDAIEAWKLDFHLGNCVKYIARSSHKGNLLEDLKKARWYLDRRIAKEEADANHD